MALILLCCKRYCDFVIALREVKIKGHPNVRMKLIDITVQVTLWSLFTRFAIGIGRHGETRVVFKLRSLKFQNLRAIGVNRNISNT